MLCNASGQLDTKNFYDFLFWNGVSCDTIGWL